MGKSKTVTAVKAFNADWTCRGFQYAVGETYEHDGNVVMCMAGFHACTNPFDVLAYYDLLNSRFAEVELTGVTSGADGRRSKVVGAEITIKAELSLGCFVSRCVDWLIAHCKDEGSSGGYAQIGSSGYRARIGSSGDCARIGSSGDGAQIGSSGDCARIGSSGGRAQIGSSGGRAQIGSSGDGAQIGSSGDGAQIGSSGDGAQIGSSGDGAQIGSSGGFAQIKAEGKKSVVASAGVDAIVFAAKGAWISVAEYRNDDCVGFATGQAGYDGVPADTWLIAKNGKLVEAK